MILEPGTKVFVSHRRLFEGDHTRFFLGTVEGYDAGIARITGNTWLRDGYTGTFCSKADERTKIISITSGAVLVYQLPSTVALKSLEIVAESTNVFLRDDKGFEMDLTEGVLQGGEGVATGYPRRSA